jgi:cytochrome c peroxidase
MGNTMEACLGTLSKIPEYQKRFKAVFGSDKLTEKHVAMAIAAFERTVLSGNSPYDKFKAGDQKALAEAQKRGMDVFMDRGQCSTCHTPPTFSNGNYYNAGVGGAKDPGRKKVTNRDADAGKFRTPALREAANTHPYFHDGSVSKLEEAVKLMASGGIDNPNLSSMLKSVRDAKLTEQDTKDLVAFLGALSGEFPVMEPPVLPQ